MCIEAVFKSPCFKANTEKRYTVWVMYRYLDYERRQHACRDSVHKPALGPQRVRRDQQHGVIARRLNARRGAMHVWSTSAVLLRARFYIKGLSHRKSTEKRHPTTSQAPFIRVVFSGNTHGRILSLKCVFSVFKVFVI